MEVGALVGQALGESGWEAVLEESAASPAPDVDRWTGGQAGGVGLWWPRGAGGLFRRHDLFAAGHARGLTAVMAPGKTSRLARL